MNEPGQATTYRPSPRHFALTLTALALGLVPLGGRLGEARDAARSLEPNASDAEAGAGGYYEGLLDGAEASHGARSELALRLLGKPTGWVRFQAANVSRPDLRDFLQFDLRPGSDRDLYGSRFTTNRHGMRDRDYDVAKPPGTFRIALLGSSIDMGWGVGDGETYENLLEDWLNAHAALRGIRRRFEVLNFAVAAYAPTQRYALLARKVEAFEPDLVLFSATMLDLRLLELHIGNLLMRHVDPTYPFLVRAIAEAGITAEETRVGPDRQLVHKEAVRSKVRAHAWSIYDDLLGALAGDCRSLGIPLWLATVPRASRADTPSARAPTVARLSGIAAHHAIPFIDLTASFDRFDPAAVEVAPWDDHPSAFGHRRIFLTLARALVEDRPLYRTLFDDDPSGPLPPP